ncbi:MAG: cobalt-precorrin-5B (C(1))-methyltransferase, partial [SAR324 cluster bacterium]|nr:cobalt-precorrin-5B (C(1))-methyltransferase [SAR324 cluster bacterium]
TSEKAVQEIYNLPDIAMLDMGDFVGGMLKYFRKHPLPKLTIGGGFGKLTKLAQGQLDLHSRRSQVDFIQLAEQLRKLVATSKLCRQAMEANTSNEVLRLAQNESLPVADSIAEKARLFVNKNLGNTETELNILVIDNQGKLAGKSKDNA